MFSDTGMSVLYTIGHSNHTAQQLIDLLSMHTISAVADVRSSPYSRYNPQFNREAFQQSLRSVDIEYVFLGKELGARSIDSSCYVNGYVQFNLLTKNKIFTAGIERLIQGMQSFRIALLCAEKDPITCHRMILICRSLRSTGMSIQHILNDGSLENNTNAELRLMTELNIQTNDLFCPGVNPHNNVKSVSYRIIPGSWIQSEVGCRQCSHRRC